MEDARQEFQVFLSPTRNYTVERPIQTQNKRRIVPVINKCPSSSSFIATQRKNSVLYKAISGVSFQETDVYEEIPSTSRQKHPSERMRTDSLTHSASKASSCQKDVNEPSGARRSRSLTNMKGEMYGPEAPQSSIVTEITHPCTPVILYSQTRGRQSRYARVRERRRASSQARPNLDNVERDDPKVANPEKPIRPRRTRSASRSRKKGFMQSFSSESSLNDSELIQKRVLSSYNENHYLITKKNRSEGIKVKTKPVHIYEDPKHIVDLDSPSYCPRGSGVDNNNIVDLRVNDMDWKKYDALITEKLDNLLRTNDLEEHEKNKVAVEPEGGYFSLERDEAETTEPQPDAFQQDNYNETIYISQTFKEKSDNEVLREDSYSQNESIELPEMELADYSTVHEVGYPEDEGLYEEIFFDPKDTQQYNPSYQLSAKENQAYFNPPPPPKTPPPQVHYVPIIEKKENSTVVYIRCNDTPKRKTPSVPNNFGTDQNIAKKDNINLLMNSVSLESLNAQKQHQNKDSRHSAWCGCCHACSARRSHSVSHSSSCIQSKSGLIAAKYASLADLNSSDEDERVKYSAPTHNISKYRRSKSYLPSLPTAGGITKSTSAADLGLSHPERRPHEPELSDIDLEIFSPKLPHNRKRKENVLVGGVGGVGGATRPTRYLKRKDCVNKYTPTCNGDPKKRSEEKIPKTFKGVLQNSIFNPPELETPIDETDPTLVIKEDQIITCITDSSSSSSDESEGGDAPPRRISSKGPFVSPWLEAKGDFEFVAFKEDKKNDVNLSKKRKTNKLLSLHKMMYGSQPELNPQQISQDIDRGSRGAQTEMAPERPSRRRTRRKSSKLAS